MQQPMSAEPMSAVPAIEAVCSALAAEEAETALSALVVPAEALPIPRLPPRQPLRQLLAEAAVVAQLWQ